MTIVIDLAPHQALALFGAVLMGLAIGFVAGKYHGVTITNKQWWIERARVHRETRAQRQLHDL